MSQVPSRRKSRPWEDDITSDDGMQHHQGEYQTDRNGRFTPEVWRYYSHQKGHGSAMGPLQAAPTLNRAKFQEPTWERPKPLSYQRPEVPSPAQPSLQPGHQQAIQDDNPSLSKRRRISEEEARQREGDRLERLRRPDSRNPQNPTLPHYPPYPPLLHLSRTCPTHPVLRASEAPQQILPVPSSPSVAPSPAVMPQNSTQSVIPSPSPRTHAPCPHQGYQTQPLLLPLPPPPLPNASFSSLGKQGVSQYVFYQDPPRSPPQSNHILYINIDFDSQFLRLSQENQELREELRKATLEFTPGKNLRGIVAQLFEVAEDYAEVVTTQQQQVQDALEAVDVRASINDRGIATTEKQTLVPRRKAISDNDLKTQDNVIAYLRGMHTTLRSKLNSLKRVGAMIARVFVLEKSIVGEMAGVDAIQTELRQENQALKLKVDSLEREKAWLEDKVRYVERENENKDTRDFITTASSPSTSFSAPISPITLTTSNPQPPYPNKQSRHPPVRAPKIRPPHASLLSATIAPSSAPSTAAYNETLNTLQHRLSVVQLELETLQSDHARLRATLQRSQARALVLEKKNAVYSEENDALSTERDRYQMLYETVEDQLSEVTASRDEYRRQAVAGGGQYSSIMAMATRLEKQGVEDRRRWKEEKEGLEREKLELQNKVAEKEVDNMKLQNEMGGLKGLGRHRDVEAGCLMVGSPSVHGALLHSTPLTAAPSASQGNCDLALTNQHLRKRIQTLENTIQEMKCEGLAIIRTAEKLLAAGET